MKTNPIHKSIKVANSKLANVLYSMKNKRLSEPDWNLLCDLYRTLGKIRAAQLEWDKHDASK